MQARVSVEVTIPDRVDEASCVRDCVALYTSPTRSPDWWDGEGGLVATWWILDVDGERWVVVTKCDTSRCTRDDFDTLTTMAESVTFVRDE